MSELNNTAKHTKGSWFIHREGFSTVYVESRIGGGMIQEVAACGPTEKGSEQQEANARLISAAPDLLEALQAMLDEDDGGYAADKARSAIYKATGGPEK